MQLAASIGQYEPWLFYTFVIEDDFLLMDIRQLLFNKEKFLWLIID